MVDWFSFSAYCCAVLCVCFCTGNLVVMPFNLTCLHCLQHSFILYYFLFVLFSQILEEYKKELCIVVTNLNMMNAEYFHPKTSPDMPVRLAVRMSMAIPGRLAVRMSMAIPGTHLYNKTHTNSLVRMSVTACCSACFCAVLCVCFLYGTFCHGAIKIGMSTLFTTFFF